MSLAPPHRELRGMTLPQHYYTSQETFDQDMDRIFRRAWLYAGHVSQLPEPGCYITVELGTTNVIVVRAEDGGSACPAQRLPAPRRADLPDPCGRSRRAFVCQYHGWSYHLDGSLATAPRMPVGLRPLALGPEAGLGRGVAGDGLCGARRGAARPGRGDARRHRGRLRAVRDRGCQGGAHDRLRRGRQLEADHGELPRVLPLPDEPPRVHRRDRHLAARGLATRSGDRAITRTTASPTCRSRRVAGRRRWTVRTRALCCSATTRRRPSRSRRRALLVSRQHDGVGSRLRDGIRTAPVAPTARSPSRTGSCPAAAVEGVDYKVEDIIALWDITNRQDFWLSELNQRGVESPAYEPGPYNLDMEDDVQHFVDAYLRMLGA